MLHQLRNNLVGVKFEDDLTFHNGLYLDRSGDLQRYETVKGEVVSFGDYYYCDNYRNLSPSLKPFYFSHSCQVKTRLEISKGDKVIFSYIASNFTTIDGITYLPYSILDAKIKNGIIYPLNGRVFGRYIEPFLEEENDGLWQENHNQIISGYGEVVAKGAMVEDYIETGAKDVFDFEVGDKILFAPNTERRLEKNEYQTLNGDGNTSLFSIFRRDILCKISI